MCDSVRIFPNLCTLLKLLRKHIIRKLLQNAVFWYQIELQGMKDNNVMHVNIKYVLMDNTGLCSLLSREIDLASLSEITTVYRSLFFTAYLTQRIEAPSASIAGEEPLKLQFQESWCLSIQSWNSCDSLPMVC